MKRVKSKEGKVYEYKHPLEGRVCLICGNSKIVSHHLFKTKHHRISWTEKKTKYFGVPLCRVCHAVVDSPETGIDYLKQIDNYLWSLEMGYRKYIL